MNTINPCPLRQSRAATTILIVTLLYIVSNIPALVTVILTARWRLAYHYIS